MKNIFHTNMMTNMAFFYKKPEGLDWETWNFSWRHKRSVIKKHLKIIFFSAQPFIVKMQFEIWKYLASKKLLPKYLRCRLHNRVQLVPKFNSHLSCSLLQLQLIPLDILHLQLTVFNSFPNIYKKWNWTEDNLQIFCLK